MTEISRKSIISLSVDIVIALVGGFFMYQTLNREPNEIIPDTPLDKDPVSSDHDWERPEISDDDLDLMDLSRSLLTGLMQIIEDEGTD